MIKNTQKGFTLIEVLAAIAITLMIISSLMTTLWYTMEARRQVEILSEPLRDGPKILALIRRDLKALLTYNVKDYKVLWGRSFVIGGQDADRIDFITATDNMIPVQFDNEPLHADWCEVGYWVRQSDENPDLLELYRREDTFSDDEPFSGGRFTLLSKRVRSFNITYFETLGYNAEPLPEWDTSRKGTLPRRIRIDLSIEREAFSAESKLTEAEEYQGRIVNFRLEFVFEPWRKECMLQGNALAPLIPQGPPKMEESSGGGKGGRIGRDSGPKGRNGQPTGDKGYSGQIGGGSGGNQNFNFKGGGSLNLGDLLKKLGGGTPPPGGPGGLFGGGR